MLDLQNINKQWTAFLDRDGVINQEKDMGYILNYDEFIFCGSALEAIRILTEVFGSLIIVTNQRGVGKGLMTENDLLDIHARMVRNIEAAGGKIDAIYYNVAMVDDDPLRKPNPGMALLAKAEFPSIELSKSIMIGNTLSDMQFGRNAGMCTVFLRATDPSVRVPHPYIDLIFNDLFDFAKALQKT